ncbi:MAG: hypothetical protein JNL73_12775 [Anaerolineales bacterium]|nr:hypothetical protein [Anaerolineales bacterium]
MTPPVEPMLRALGPALDAVTPDPHWPAIWARVNAAVQRRRVPLWPLLASGTLCLTLFLSSTIVGVVMGVTPTAAAEAAPVPVIVSQRMTPDETQAAGASAGPAAATTPAPIALPVR